MRLKRFVLKKSTVFFEIFQTGRVGSRKKVLEKRVFAPTDGGAEGEKDAEEYLRPGVFPKFSAEKRPTVGRKPKRDRVAESIPVLED